MDYLRETEEGVEPLLFFAYGRTNQERSSPPLLTTLLLLTGEPLEEVGGVKNESDGTSEAWELQGAFFFFAIAVRFSFSSASTLWIY